MNPRGLNRRTLALLAVSLLARLPLEMLTIGLLVHARHLTGSFASAGLVTGMYGVAVGLGGPLLGRVADRVGGSVVLLVSGIIASALLVVIALLPSRPSLTLLVVAAMAMGMATPPVGACIRSRIPALLDDPGAARRAYALEAALVELAYVAGPALVICIGALYSSRVALVLVAATLLPGVAAVAAFTNRVDSGRGIRRTATRARTSRIGPLRTPAMCTFVIVLGAIGVLLGADEVAVIATADTAGSPGSAALLLMVWGIGSFAGGVLLTRIIRRPENVVRPAIILGALAAGHLALVPAHVNLIALGGVLFVAGMAIAPGEATIYAMVSELTAAGSATEAFAWLAGAMELGAALGAAAGGWAVDAGGPVAAFTLGAAAGVVALATSAIGLRARPDGRCSAAVPDHPFAADRSTV